MRRDRLPPDVERPEADLVRDLVRTSERTAGTSDKIDQSLRYATSHETAVASAEDDLSTLWIDVDEQSELRNLGRKVLSTMQVTLRNTQFSRSGRSASSYSFCHVQQLIHK